MFNHFLTVFSYGQAVFMTPVLSVVPGAFGRAGQQYQEPFSCPLRC